MGENEEFLRLVSEIDMATITATICKPGMVYKMNGVVYQNFPHKGLVDKVRPWLAFVYANLFPRAHISDVSRERAISFMLLSLELL